MAKINNQKKGKDPRFVDYGGPSTLAPPTDSSESREQRGYSGWEPSADTPRSFNPPAGQPSVYQPDSKDTGPDLKSGARQPPFFVQPGADRDRPNIPKDTIEPVRSYGYEPRFREAPTKDIPAEGPRAQFRLPLPENGGGTTVRHQAVGDPISQDSPRLRGNGGSAGPGGHGPIAYIDTPPAQAPPSAVTQPPFDIVRRSRPINAESSGPVQGRHAYSGVAPSPPGDIDPINYAEKPKTGSQAPAYSLSPQLREPTQGVLPLGSGTRLPRGVKGLDDLGYPPPEGKPADTYAYPSDARQPAQPERAPSYMNQVPNKTYPTPRSDAGRRLAPPDAADPAGQLLFRRQRKPDPDETKSGNQ